MKKGKAFRDWRRWVLGWLLPQLAAAKERLRIRAESVQIRRTLGPAAAAMADEFRRAREAAERKVIAAFHKKTPPDRDRVYRAIQVAETIPQLDQAAAQLRRLSEEDQSALQPVFRARQRFLATDSARREKDRVRS